MENFLLLRVNFYIFSYRLLELHKLQPVPPRRGEIEAKIRETSKQHSRHIGLCIFKFQLSAMETFSEIWVIFYYRVYF